MAVLLSSLATSCPRPMVFAVRRSALIGAVGTNFVLPQSIEFAGLRYEQPKPRSHWWSAPPPASFCSGYASYRLRRYPSEWSSGWDTLVVLPNAEVEVVVTRGSPASAIIFFGYTLVHRRPSERPWSDSTLTPSEQAAAAKLKRGADAFVGQLVGPSSAQVARPPIDTLETDSVDGARAACDRMLRAAL